MSIPNCAGRFPELCKVDFPSVLNYDYETNYFTRGINNREFRWQDIQVPANWLFVEATRSGDFENNSFANVAGYTGTTGLYLITTGSVADRVSYSPWNVSGGYTVYIPTSGARLTTGNLPQYTGRARTVNPIQGNQSIGLYCYNYAYPRIYSDIIPVNVTGIQNDKDHQVYALAYCNFYQGNTPRAKLYVQALNGTTPIGYYDPVNSIWTPERPSGFYYVPSGKYTEIKFKFSPATSPLAVANGYSVWFETESTGAFITVDELHLDQLMERNPYMSGIIPDGYMVQVSPDLGWHDKRAMMSQASNGSNPFAKTFGPYTVANGNLVDNLDGSVTAVIDEADFKKIVNSNYKKYLWRAFPISPNGALGVEAEPEVFEYVGNRVDKDFIVEEVQDDPLSTIKVIVGKKSERMTILVDDIANSPNLHYLSPYDWKLTVNVLLETQVVKVQGKDEGGATTSPYFLELKNNLYTQQYESLWNTFDEHGTLLDIKRLPQESNDDYKLRIQDVTRNPGGSTFAGVANSSTRELGLIKIPDALTLSVPKDKYGLNLHSSVFVEFGSVYFRTRTSTMIIKEKLFVDPVYMTVTLSKYATEMPISIRTENGINVPISSITFEVDEETPSVCRLKIDYPAAKGMFVDIEYEYYEQLLYKNYPTLGDLEVAISRLTDNTGHSIVTCKSTQLLSGNENCLGLFISFSTLVGDSTFSVAWTPIRIRRISDKFFREYFYTEGKSYRNTNFYSYITELKSNSRTLWGSVESDRDYWDAADNSSKSFDHVPTLMDPEIVSYNTVSPQSGLVPLDSAQAWGRSYVGNRNEDILNAGLDVTLFQPGVAHTSDLMPGIETFYSRKATPEDLRLTVSPTRFDNNFVIFSGQR
jgi:hypothetical protein